MRWIAIGLICLVPGLAPAQTPDSQTLADLRAELATLGGQIARLRNELSTTGADQTGISDTTPVLQRLDLLEQELRRVTGSVEKIQFEVERIAEDGTRRIADLNFRLVELEGGDIGDIADTPPLGTGTATGDTTALATGPRPRPRPAPGALPGGPPSVPLAPLVTEPVTTPSVALSEQGAFEAALASFRAGDHSGAERQFAAFIADYPGGALSAEAAFWRGEAQSALGDDNAAARSYLDSFSGAPTGAKAPEALLSLGAALGRLGLTSDACQTLGEVGVRYPALDPDIAQRTEAERRVLGCP